jgi:hypothetical protein
MSKGCSGLTNLQKAIRRLTQCTISLSAGLKSSGWNALMAPKLDTVETLFTPPFGAVEGLNLRINLCMRKSNGYRSFELLQISLF